MVFQRLAKLVLFDVDCASVTCAFWKLRSDVSPGVQPLLISSAAQAAYDLSEASELVQAAVKNPVSWVPLGSAVNLRPWS